MCTRNYSALVLLLTLLTASASAQEEAPAEPFFDVTEVEIVNVDVWVTDKSGQSVAGLGRDDFVVYRDGTQVEITNFFAVENGRPAGSELAAITPLTYAQSLEDDAPTDPTQLPEEHQVWLIVYIDNYNIDPIERNRVFPALRQFLNQTLGPGDKAMIVTYNRALNVHQPFTDNVPLLMDSLEPLEGMSGFATIRKRDQVSTLKLIDNATSAGKALQYARQYAEEQMNAVQYTTEALERLISTLGGLPGRKALVYVSSGVPMVAGEEMFHVVAEKFDTSSPYSEIPRHDTSRSFEKINRFANSNRVVFYTVDAGGLRGMEFGNAEYGGFVDSGLRSTLDSVVPENLQSTLRLMAIETGGRAILNQNEILPALRESAQDFNSFYSLGISSAGADQGRYHELKVKFREKRKGLRLRHRAGYRSKDLETRVRDSLTSALLYEQESNPLEVKVAWGNPEPYDDDKYLLPIRLQIPLANVVLLPTEPGKHETRLRLFVAAVGEAGAKSEIDDSPLGLRIDDEHVEAAKKESLVHTHQLLLSKGRKKVGVAILDTFGRESSVITRSVQVGPDIGN